MQRFALPRTVDLAVDGVAQGRTPRSLDLSAGQHLVRLTNGDQATEFPITVVAGSSNRWCYAFAAGELYADVCPR